MYIVYVGLAECVYACVCVYACMYTHVCVGMCACIHTWGLYSSTVSGPSFFFLYAHLNYNLAVALSL